MKPDDVSRLGCIACRIDGYGYVPAEIHHCRTGGMKRDNAEIIGLCPYHHRTGHDSIHMAKASFRAKYGQEEDLVRLVKVAVEDMKRNTIGGKP